MQSAKAFLICMNASSGVTVDASGKGGDNGDNNCNGIWPSGATAGSRTTPSIEGQGSSKTQIKRRGKSDTPPDSLAGKSDIYKPIVPGVAFRWHFLILVQAVVVS